MFYSIGKVISFIFCKTYIRLKAFGTEHIPREGAFILVSNHLSYLDPLVLGVACPRNLNFMAREDLFNIPLFSNLIRIVDVFPVKRDTADLFAIKEALRRLKKGRVVAIFPEGSRKKEGVVMEPEAGVGFLAYKSGVPIIPSFIEGTDLAMPRGAWFIKPKKVRVYFGQEIHLERRKPSNYHDIAREIMHCIRHLSCA
jgi:1-acyl-sn-glycerol-3-phosphate acyltransferase